jgi:5-formyltetrahydrofolate cyclo-ligase
VKATARTKGEWRRWAKATRAQLDVGELSAQLTTTLQAWPTYGGAQHVLTYLAFGREIDLSGLSGRRFYAPRTHPNGALTVHALTGRLKRHPYGFDEPSTESPQFEVGRLELLLVPGLAFDAAGNRLGYGRGFYDRLLVGVPQGVPIVGVVPTALIVEALPAEAHDVAMTHLLSERGIFEV